MKHTQNSKVQKVIISLMSFFFGHIEVFVPIQVFIKKRFLKFSGAMKHQNASIL